MAKRTRKGKELLKSNLIDYILFSLFFIFTFCSIILINKNIDYHKIYQKDNLSLKEEILLQEENIKKLQEEITSYQNIDDTISNTKKNYYQELKRLEDSILDGSSSKKIAYLTFDDGPYYSTYRVFDILDQYGVKATFFTTNTNGEYCYDNKSENCQIRYQEYLDRGHTIANHTYTHAIFRGLYNSVDTFMDAVIKQEELVYSKTGYKTNILRFPGGSATARGLKDSIIEKLRERGYGWVDWNAMDGDGGALDSSTQAWNIFVNSIDEKLEVILYHDYNDITISLLPDMIEYLQNNGYVCLPLFYESSKINK
ncbi:MAG: polysaccharide deacetylase family protein [Bacilli bacterium]|nr:polysaccharide deacetylase family protein [Bacilli bacterium]